MLQKAVTSKLQYIEKTSVSLPHLFVLTRPKQPYDSKSREAKLLEKQNLNFRSREIESRRWDWGAQSNV
jgi:hypothetical protein